MSKTDSSSIKMNGDKVRATLELETTMTAGEGVKRKTLAEMLSEGLCSCEEGFGSRMSCAVPSSRVCRTPCHPQECRTHLSSTPPIVERGAIGEKNTVQLEKNGVLGTRGRRDRVACVYRRRRRSWSVVRLGSMCQVMKSHFREERGWEEVYRWEERMVSFRAALFFSLFFFFVSFFSHSLTLSLLSLPLSSRLLFPSLSSRLPSFSFSLSLLSF